MANDSDYMHELYSSCCISSRLNTTKRQKDHCWLLFQERIELNFGALDKLLANGLLNEMEYDDIKNSQSSITGYKKLSEYTELAWKRSACVCYDVFLAARFAKQQHLVNYAESSGMYNSKFGGDWPLTDRQRMALNVNQEVLLELMEMSPALIEELYSRNVLTKRHKDFICGPLAEIKKIETFLDILRRRSFRDYKETIKCLRALNQTHIAEILEGGAVIRILCTLKESKSCTMDRHTMETLVQKFSEELRKQTLDSEDEKLQLTKIGLIGVKFDNAIVLYFKCKTKNDLQDLEKVLDNREIEAMAESDFMMLLSRDDDPFIATLDWSQEDYNRCEYYLRRGPFSDTCIVELPPEVREIVLTKAYALHFYRVHPTPREKELFVILSSISRDWHEIIYRRRFKASLNRCLYPYFLSISKRQAIIRSNRQYLVEHLEPSSNLIRRLEQVGCLTSEEANYIESLERKSAKNHELLIVAWTMSFRKHFVFVESLHLCGQRKVANVLEKGGVVFKTMANCSGISTYAEFIKRLNEKISESDREYGELEPHIRLYDIAIPREFEMLDVQPLARRRRNENIVIWLWCKSHRSSRQIGKLAESDHLLKLLDILMSFICWKGTEQRRDLLQLFSRGKLSLQFLKTLSLKTMQFQRTVVDRQLSVKLLGEFELPLYSQAVTSLDDKIYFLTDDGISIHQYMAPFARQWKTVFPPSQSPEVYPDNHGVLGSFIEACHQTKCIYVARGHDQRVWKLTTPEYNLEVWMDYLATLCSLSVASNGNILIVKSERHVNLPDGGRFLEIYTNDAVRLFNIDLDKPFNVSWQESPSVLEISPGHFAIKYKNTLLVKSVNFDTMTATDQNRVQYPGNGREPYYGHITSIALYSVNRLIAVLNGGLAILDSRLNIEFISRSVTVDAYTLHYLKDKGQLMAFSSGMKYVQIYTLQYEGEDWFTDNGDSKHL